MAGGCRHDLAFPRPVGFDTDRLQRWPVRFAARAPLRMKRLQPDLLLGAARFVERHPPRGLPCQPMFLGMCLDLTGALRHAGNEFPGNPGDLEQALAWIELDLVADLAELVRKVAPTAG